MIRCYTGVPGSGKSLHVIRKIVAYLQAGKMVISNFPLRVDAVEKNIGRYFYMPNDRLTIPYIMQFARTMHKPKQENQTLFVIDEASVKFNSRTFMEKDRLAFLSFFAQHRKYGFEIILVQQDLRQIDRQIRDMVELEVEHRKMNNYKLYKLCPFPLFCAIEFNIGIRDKNNHEFFLYSHKYGDLYDTYFEFDSKIDIKLSKIIQQDIITSEIVPASRKKSRPNSQKKAPGYDGPPCRETGGGTRQAPGVAGGLLDISNELREIHVDKL